MLIYAVCARKGKGGIITGLGMFVLSVSCFFFPTGRKKNSYVLFSLGDHGNLFVTMTAQTSSLSDA